MERRRQVLLSQLVPQHYLYPTTKGRNGVVKDQVLEGIFYFSAYNEIGIGKNERMK